MPPKSAELASNALSVGFVDMVLQSSPVVFAVLLVLVCLSVFTWALLVVKWRSLKKILARNQEFEAAFHKSPSLKGLHDSLDAFPYSPSRELFRAGYSELQRSTSLYGSRDDQLVLAALLDNQTRVLRQAKIVQRMQLERFLTFLSICASAAPFIGLFGTVWGIMAALAEVGRTGSTSLAAIAPGISEALIATAFGLAAAIPAVIAYNLSSSRIRRLMIDVEGFSNQFLNLISRHYVKRTLLQQQQSASPAAPSGARKAEV